MYIHKKMTRQGARWVERGREREFYIMFIDCETVYDRVGRSSLNVIQRVDSLGFGSRRGDYPSAPTHRPTDNINQVGEDDRLVASLS
jgi:hypothetical protein